MLYLCMEFNLCIDMTKEQRTRQGIFWAVTIGYGLFYVCRLSINVLKKGIVDDGIATESQLGIIGSALFFAYAVGKFVNGFLADRVNLRFFMSGALLICAIANAVLAIGVPFWFFVVLWALNGWFQSAGAPCSIISLKRWFGHNNYGTVYGYWSASHNIGEALTFLVTAAVVSAWGWRAGFLSAAAIGLFGVLIILVFLQHYVTPEEQNLTTAEKQKNIGKKQREVLKMPIIWVVALASAFFYIGRYAVNSWGIYFLQNAKDYDTVLASSTIAINSVCGIIGTVASGLISDKLFGGDRIKMAWITSAINLGSLLLFLLVPNGYYWIDCAAMVLFGLSVGVLLCFLGGLIAVDVAPAEAAGAAIGIIGIASYAAAGLQDIVSGYLIEDRKSVIEVMNEAGEMVQQTVYDFSAIRFFWIGAAALSLLLLLIIYFRQLKQATHQ